MEKIKQKKCKHDFEVIIKKSKSTSGNMEMEYLDATCKKCGFSEQYFTGIYEGKKKTVNFLTKKRGKTKEWKIKHKTNTQA